MTSALLAESLRGKRRAEQKRAEAMAHPVTRSFVPLWDRIIANHDRNIRDCIALNDAVDLRGVFPEARL